MADLRPGACDALTTDLYELNMAVSYLRRGMVGPATFSLFARRLPPARGFLVAAGLEQCLDFLESFRFTADDLGYLRQAVGYPDEDLDRLAGVRFTGEVWAVPEGRVVLANEPLLEVTAPIAEAQLVESVLLNEITFQTSVASKAARCRVAAAGADLVDFALRRTQGVAAALRVARLSAMVGFASTSNVAAARQHGLVPSGTMAHSYVEAFPSEAEAFRAFAHDFPDRATFLVDTYDTLAGVRTAIAVIRDLGSAGPFAIRLDSGDLAALARAARDLLDDAGLPHVRIVASGNLDEYAIADLVDAHAPIDVYGVGTRMGVSADAPYLDTAYKLVQYGDRPVAKVSPGKRTLPGRKQVFRGAGTRDLLGLREESDTSLGEPLLRPAMVAGHRVQPAEPLAVARRRFEADLAALPEHALAVRDPRPPEVTLTATLQAEAAAVWARLGAGPAGP